MVVDLCVPLNATPRYTHFPSRKSLFPVGMRKRKLARGMHDFHWGMRDLKTNAFGSGFGFPARLAGVEISADHEVRQCSSASNDDVNKRSGKKCRQLWRETGMGCRRSMSTVDS